MRLAIGWRSPLRRRAVYRSIPWLALIVIAASVSFAYHRLLISQRDMVEHTYQVLTTLEATLVSIIDAETGQRGYVITGDDAYLAPYRRSIVEIPAALARLRALIADAPPQLARERALDAALQTKLAELSETIAIRNAAGIEAARVAVMRDRGRVVMDQVRHIVADMRAAETSLLTRRSAEARTTERRLVAVTVACMLASLLARIGLALVARRRG